MLWVCYAHPMKLHPIIIAGLVITALLIAQPSRPCTTFMMQQDGPVVGKSYDWDIGVALVVINKQRQAKSALLLQDGVTPVSWTSRFASLTFNQYGVELPNSGINEAGLVVEVMWLNSSVYPQPDARPAINELQWVQWALDMHADVSELVTAAPEVRVAPSYASIHYLACDARGECAAFEFLNGVLTITSGDSIVVNTLTNSTYADSLTFLRRHEGFGGSSPVGTSNSSLDRFVRASSLALQTPTESMPASAFAILDSVSQGSYSQWNLVYELSSGQVYFRTYSSAGIKSVALSDFDLGCESPTMLLDINHAATGDVADAFTPYNSEQNRNLLNVSMAPIASQIPPGTVDRVVSYPEQVVCEAEDRDKDKEPKEKKEPEVGLCAAGIGGSPLAMLLVGLGLLFRRRRGLA